MQLFTKAWLPDFSADDDIFKSKQPDDKNTIASEIGMLIGEPVNGFVRGSFQRANRLYFENHIFVMTKDAEDLLKTYANRRIDVTVLADNEEQNYDF